MATVTIFDTSKLPSRHATVGPDRAPHRSYYFAMGLRREDIEAPFVDVVTTWNEAAPCNIALARRQRGRELNMSPRGWARPSRDWPQHDRNTAQTGH
jgi:dihydroxy-acid dehydratase